MTILTVGDSFTFGLELPDLPAKHLDFFCQVRDQYNQNPKPVAPSKLAWPTKLATRLGTDVDNVSIPGASNDWIFKKAIQHTLSKQYQLVVVAWTCVDRYDFAYQQRDLQLSASNQSIASFFPWFKSFVADHHDFLLAYDKWICHAIALEAFLKMNNQPYVFANAMTPHVIQDSGKLYSSFDDIKSKFDQQHYIEWESSFESWCQGLPVGPGGHFLEAGHELVAEKIYNFLK